MQVIAVTGILSKDLDGKPIPVKGTDAENGVLVRVEAKQDSYLSADAILVVIP